MAVRTNGVNPDIYRFAGIMISGILAGMGGIYLSFEAGAFTKNISAGRGYIAIAALIFGGWKPFPVFIGCLLFGFFEALQMSLQGTFLPTGIIQSLPYLMTILFLVIFASKYRAPAALGNE